MNTTTELQMPALDYWKAKRSGAGMTITGQDQAGKEVRVSGVVEITSGKLGVIATTATGDQYLLNNQV